MADRQAAPARRRPLSALRFCVPRSAFLTLLLLGLCATCRAETWEDANVCFQCRLFSPKLLFSEPAETVAQRLGVALQSQGAGQTIWQAKRARFCGLPVAEIRLFGGVDGLVRGVEVNLINKGDFFDQTNVLRTALELRQNPREAIDAGGNPSRKIERHMKKDFEDRFSIYGKRLSTGLTRLFGAVERQTFKRAERRRVERWNWGEVTFLLDAEEGEFLMLRIMPAQQADARGKGERISDAAIKRRLDANVVRERNGDIRIDNIPMVDQGDKGYCAVASAERLLRYFSIPVDSHELAQMAETDKFGGTTVPDLTRAMKIIASRNRRTYKRLGKTPSARSLAKYIEKGIPIIWAMYVTLDMEVVAAQRRERRPEFSIRAWKKILAEQERQTRRIRPDHNGAHIRLIVGCNPDTGEIAYSDSWGRQGNVFWITEREAKTVSMPTGLAAVVP